MPESNNLQPILMQLEAAIPLQLTLPTLDQSENQAEC